MKERESIKLVFTTVFHCLHVQKRAALCEMESKRKSARERARERACARARVRGVEREAEVDLLR